MTQETGDMRPSSRHILATYVAVALLDMLLTTETHHERHNRTKHTIVLGGGGLHRERSRRKTRPSEPWLRTGTTMVRRARYDARDDVRAQYNGGYLGGVVLGHWQSQRQRLR